MGLLALPMLISRSGAQALPADTGTAAPGVGFSLPRLGGSLSYALTGSESVSNGFYNGGTSTSTNFSGDVAYVSKSRFHPFSAIYNGGVLLANSGQPTTYFQSLSFSQILNTKRWNIALADSVSYLPASPVGGLSGVPGIGDLGVDPVAVVPSAGLGILTAYGPRVSNTASGTVSRQINGRISAQATGIYAIQRFIGDNAPLGIDNTAEGGSAGVSYHFSARDTITGSYNYSTFSFSGANYGFSAQGATIDYSRRWSARLQTDVNAGPQIISGSSLAVNGSSVQIAAGASASYLTRTTAYSLIYARGVNNGSGVVPGAFADSLMGSAHRQFGRDWAVSGTVGFSRNVSLPNFQLYTFNGKAVTAGVQGSRAFGRSFSGFLSYTLENQTTSSPNFSSNAPNAFSGFYQIFSAGVTYSPRSFPLGR